MPEFQSEWSKIEACIGAGKMMTHEVSADVGTKVAGDEIGANGEHVVSAVASVKPLETAECCMYGVTVMWSTLLHK